jgi:hypothetical protein
VIHSQTVGDDQAQIRPTVAQSLLSQNQPAEKRQTGNVKIDCNVVVGNMVPNPVPHTFGQETAANNNDSLPVMQHSTLKKQQVLELLTLPEYGLRVSKS